MNHDIAFFRRRRKQLEAAIERASVNHPIRKAEDPNWVPFYTVDELKQRLKVVKHQLYSLEISEQFYNYTRNQDPPLEPIF